jgi:hypothetical protein
VRDVGYLELFFDLIAGGALTGDAALRGGLWTLAVLIEYASAVAGFPVPGLGRSQGIAKRVRLG